MLHECSINDLTFGNKPIEAPCGGVVSFPVQCRVCGRKFEQTFSETDGLWDPVQEDYVFLPVNSEKGVTIENKMES